VRIPKYPGKEIKRVIFNKQHMMNSAYDDEDDDGGFGPNPFRVNHNDLLDIPLPNPTPQQQPQQQYAASNVMLNQPLNQPDPQSGMTGSFQLPPASPPYHPPQNVQQAQQNQQQHFLPGSPSQLRGAMDQQALPGSRKAPYGGTDEIASTPTSLLSWRSCVKCVRLDSYVQYFDMDTRDILLRLKASVTTFWQPDQFRTAVLGDPSTADENDLSNLKGPDLYGPLWVSMTLIFVLAVTSNLSAYLHHWQKVKRADDGTPVDAFEFDIRHLVRASSVVMTMTVGVPTVLFLACVCVGMSGIPWALWVCCYGYAQVPFLLAAAVVWVWPHEIWEWSVLLAAMVVSGTLVLRNMSTPLLSQDVSASQSKAAPIAIAILACHVIYAGVLKVSFYE
jgi:hypothetical protein